MIDRSVLQLFTDPENQPTQYGTVTLEYVQREIAAEREACAKLCDELHWPWRMGDNSGPKECAAAIRARST